MVEVFRVLRLNFHSVTERKKYILERKVLEREALEREILEREKERS